ncbi:MAG TPA: PD-(D/E)XK nuclease family protein [Gemmatimonadales bacterium]|nr:PD-(D/E)XK nuclease family protein [Gemmatimonadales bacterium]
MNGYGDLYNSEGVQVKWNSHSIADAQKCLRYYDWSNRQGWHWPGGNVHFSFGGHYAKAHQRYYLYRAAGMSRIEAVNEVVHQALIDTWEHELDAKGNRIPGTGKPVDWGHHLKDRGTLIRTIVWYYEQFKDDLPILEIGGQPAVEVKFELDLDDGNVLVGTLDRVIDYSGSTFIMDQKTTGSTLTPKFFDQWKPNTQMSAYTFAGQAVFHQPVKGVLIDAVQIAVGFSRFERGPTYRTQSELDEWYDTAMHHIERAQRATRYNYFPPTETSCDLFGGCIFRSVCSQSPEVRENFLRSKFTREP